MKCGTCSKYAVEIVGDHDYTQFAGLKGKTVELRDVTIHVCNECRPERSWLEIPCLAQLHRELEAADRLRVKQLWCTFNEGMWRIAFSTTPLAGTEP